MVSSSRGGLKPSEESDIAHGLHASRDRPLSEAIQSQRRKNETPLEMWERFLILADVPEASLMKLHEDQTHGGKGGGMRGAMRPGKRLCGLSMAMVSYLDNTGLKDVDADHISRLRAASRRSGVSGGDLSVKLRKRLAEKRPKCSEAVEMVLVQGMSQRQAAGNLGLSHVAVRKRLITGLELLLYWTEEYIGDKT